MELAIIGILALVILLVLMFLSVPIGFCFAITGFCGLWYVVGFPGAVSTLKTVAYYQVANYTWAVFPLFMLMGEIAGQGDLTSDAFEAAKKFLGHLRGGLAVATTAAATLFGAVSGSAMATSVTFTKVAWPEMRKAGYAPSLGIGSILCAASTDSLIPPSIPFVIYAMLADESVGRLFIGGIIPGLLLAVTLLVTVWIWVIIDPKVAPVIPAAPWKERFKSLPKIWAILLLVVVVMGGLWGGIFTANEAAGIGAFGAFVISLALKRLTWKGTVKMFVETGAMTANIFFLIVAVQVFNNLLQVTSLPALLADWVVGLHLAPTTVLIFILFIYAILGIPLEMAPILLLTVPVFVPLLVTVGIDKVWFGILSTITVGLASISPPVGAPMFLAHAIVKKDGVTLNSIFNGCWIFCIPTVATLIICLIWPQLTLWLPNSMFGK
jgi:C4-dicarboxylate transporter, DctM subunit